MEDKDYSEVCLCKLILVLTFGSPAAKSFSSLPGTGRKFFTQREMYALFLGR